LIKLNLPIEEVLSDLKRLLTLRHEVVLQAPPGAGKTTLIPLALKDEPWLGGKKILMLEPRRLATRSAAYRMASLLNESPGQTVGYRMRLDTTVGKNTRIEVITEGILTRMLQHDPSLDDVGLVIFDEFHERNLESDLALGLCLKGRALFRNEADQSGNPLKILVMSATLESSKVAGLLQDAPIIQSQGKQYPVDVIYGRASQPRDSIVERTVATVVRALEDNTESSVLVFLPGQGEIRRVTESLATWISDRKIQDVRLNPLYGNLSIEDQQTAIAPLPGAGLRKVVIATNIAETSLTIEGIDIVIDSGLVREPVFDPATGMTRLQTRKISRASSIQRMGRAGRLRPGRCYRLWSEDQQQQLASHATPEILQADLAPLALQLMQWGVEDPAELDWLDAPPAGPWQQAIELLVNLGALVKTQDRLVLTRHGKFMASLPTHPRLAHLLVCGASLGHADIAVSLASILSDRDPFGQENPDIAYRLAILSGESTCPDRHRGWTRRTQQLARQFNEQISRLKITADTSSASFTRDQVTGYLLSCAYPDRIARSRHSGGYQLANGRSANLVGNHILSKAKWLAVAEVGGSTRSKGDTIRSAAPLDPTLFGSLLNYLVVEQTVADWDKKTHRFVAENRKMIGALILERTKLDSVPIEARRQALIEHIRGQGLELLPWTPALRQWQSRVLLLRSLDNDRPMDEQWPDVSDSALLETLADWLGPYLDNITLLSHFKKIALGKVLNALLSWDKSRQLNALAPIRFEVPSGSNIAIDYTQSPPVLAVKLQEMFGCDETPSIARGKVHLMVHLLSPAGRPLQVTRDLAGFWRSSYHDVKRDMKGRYPKHPWPDDPLTAIPTNRTKSKN